MKTTLFLVLILSCGVAGCRAAQALKTEPVLPAAAAPAPPGCVILPGPTNAIQFRLYTNAAADAAHVFNTFDIEAYGQLLLRSPGGEFLKRGPAARASQNSLHSILVDGEGPGPGSTNSMTVIEHAAGPDWSYTALDGTGAYRGRLKEFRRGILYVEPDLFVLYDHLVAEKPVYFQMFLHPPTATGLDSIWHDLRLDLPKAGFRIHTPGERRTPRFWERIESASDELLPGTVTMRVGPTNRVTKLDVLTVFAVHRGGEKKDYAFKLLESNTAVGARIHREGLPTLVAFRVDPAAGPASLIGFAFTGPVGVDVFRPKQRPAAK